MKKLKPSHVVGIGGSAGGLQAYRAILDNLPSNTGMSFVFVAHMRPTGESLLAEILSWSSKMPVAQAAEGMVIQSDHVYVIPPNTDLSIEGETFKISSPRSMKGGRHKQVDCFLESLAENFGSRAIGIILSGGDGDGTEGCKAIKSHGGITFAQDLSAEVDSMPRHAVASGCVDFSLPPKGIADELIKIASRSV